MSDNDFEPDSETCFSDSSSEEELSEEEEELNEEEEERIEEGKDEDWGGGEWNVRPWKV